MSEVASLVAKYQANGQERRAEIAELQAMIYQDILSNLLDMQKTGVHLPTLLKAILEEVEASG